MVKNEPAPPARPEAPPQPKPSLPPDFYAQLLEQPLCLRTGECDHCGKCQH